MTIHSPTAYKLEAHLEYLCTNNEEYKNLYTTLYLNKKICDEMLKTVALSYPHFSLHDSSHSETVISNIEMMLGSERIKSLTPTDTWLLLHAAYLHDIGMILLYDDIVNLWASDDFKDFWDDVKQSHDNDLMESIEYLEKIQQDGAIDPFSENAKGKPWPLETGRRIKYILSCFFRGRHASMSNRYITKMPEKLKTDLSHNGLIPNRLIHVLGEIAFSHSTNIDYILTLDRKTNGFNTDYAHPCFVAMLVRIGDTLDIDNGRFSTYLELVDGPLPNISKIHKMKHESTRHLLVSPTCIEYRCDCNNVDTYREVQKWLTGLEDEIRIMTLNWTYIIPDGFVGHAPKLTKKTLLLKGKPDNHGLAKLRLNISQEKAFEIIEGSNIYKDEYIFIREFIQNSLDAIKIQMWRDIRDGFYRDEIFLDTDKNLKPVSELAKLYPFDIPTNVYGNYGATITIKKDDMSYVNVTIEDNGTGISYETLKYLCKTGESYSVRKQAKREIAQMPVWLQPTGGFGVGLQSAFRVANSFKISTKAGGETIDFMVRSRGKGDGYIQPLDDEKDSRTTRGTTIAIHIKDDPFSYSVGGFADEYRRNNFDFVDASNSGLSYKILDVAANNCLATFFDVAIRCEDMPILHLPKSEVAMLFYKGDRCEKDNYVYSINKENTCVTAWHKDNAILFRYNASVAEHSVHDIIAFKGIDVEYRARWYNASIRADIYGEDTKQSLLLDRKTLTKEYAKRLDEHLLDALIFCVKRQNEFISCIGESGYKHITDNAYSFHATSTSVIGNSPRDHFNPLAFILSCSRHISNFDINAFSYMFDDIKGSVKILEMEDNGQYKMKSIPISSIIKGFPCYTYIHRPPFEHHTNGARPDDSDYTDMCNSYTKGEDKGMIIADYDFEKLLIGYTVAEIRCIFVDNGHMSADIITTTNKITGLIKLDEETSDSFIRDMVSYGRVWSNDGIRGVMPATERYKGISIKWHYNGHNPSSYRIANVYMICSPIITPNAKLAFQLSKDAFIAEIISHDDFTRLVDFTLKNANDEYTYKTESDIIEGYKELIGKHYDLVTA